MKKWRGRPAAPGKGRGTAFVLPRAATAAHSGPAAPDVSGELERLAEGRRRYLGRLAALARQAGESEADILAAYEAIAGDEGFFGEVAALVREEGLSAAAALEQKRAEVAALFAALPDEVMRRRADDVDNVCREVNAAMAGEEELSLPGAGEYVVFAEDLSPVQTLQLDRSRLRGLVTERGGQSSHTAILAGELGIPAVVGAGRLLEEVPSGADALVDGATGEVVARPDGATLNAFLAARAEEEEKRVLWAEAARHPGRTRDGVAVGVWANTGDAFGAAALDFAACDGVGLFRTEFLYLGRDGWPDEEAQYVIYRDIARRAGGKPVIIRTLDVGADKQAAYMHFPAEENPALGLRGIRRSLREPEVFTVQLRALLRAAADGDLRVMLPMVAAVEEVRAARALLAGAAGALAREGVPHRKDPPLGIMVETPAAVFMADKLAAECDFFSLGTNDLAQYVLAADRMDEQARGEDRAHSPALLRAAAAACEAARKAGIPVGICGEAAAGPLLPLWVAMGVAELSVLPALVGRVKYRLGRVDTGRAGAALADALACATAAEVRERLEALAAE